jgi:uncharacterized protein YegL
MCKEVDANTNSNALTNYVKHGNIPTKDYVNGGIFAQHFFNVNPTNEPITEVIEAKLFYSEFYHPVSKTNQKYFMIGLLGSDDGKNRRDTMDVVIVIDRSGSMGSGLYDTDAKTERSQQKSKMELTIEATKEIFEIFDEDEQIGIIAFDNKIEMVQELQAKRNIDNQKLFKSLNSIQPRGGTNMEIGMETAIQMLLSSPNKQRKKRIIFITDDCPNIGLDEKGLKGMAENAYVTSNRTIEITYVGIGLTFNIKLSEESSKVHGKTIF